MINFREFLDLCEDYNPNADFVIFNKKTRAVPGTAGGFDQVKTKATICLESGFSKHLKT